MNNTKKVPNYENGIIYKLVCKDPSVTDIYIGSTTNKAKRKSHHIEEYNKQKQQFKLYNCIRMNGGFANWDLVEIEKYPTDCRTNLCIRERYWIDKCKPSLNTQIPSRTRKEYMDTNNEYIKEKRREYYSNNRDKLVAATKKSREKNDTSRKYYEKNKELLKDKVKTYNKDNKDKIKARTNRPYQCECGLTVRFKQRLKHMKTNKHISRLSS